MTALSALRRLHSHASGALAAALRSLPEYAEHHDALSRLRAELASRTRPVTVTPEEVADQLAAALVAGQPIPDDIDARAHQASTAAADFDAGQVVLLEALNRLDAKLDTIAIAGTNALFAHLDGALRDVVTEAREIGLDGVTDGETAIAAGKADEYAAVLALRDRYLDIRRAQSELMNKLAGENYGGPTVLESFGFVRNYAELYPAWLIVARGDREAMAATGLDLEPPWPPAPNDQFVWLANHPQGDAWIPTPSQLSAARADARTAADEAARQAVAESRQPKRIHREPVGSVSPSMTA